MKQQEVQERDFYSIAEAAKRIGCSRGLIWKQCDKGIIPYQMFGNKMFVPAKYTGRLLLCLRASKIAA